MNIDDAEEQFLKLVDDVAETGEEVIVLHDGKPIVKIIPFGEKRKRTPSQKAALDAFLEFARSSTDKSDGPWTREELYERE